jgi:hypothetical protein
LHKSLKSKRDTSPSTFEQTENKMKWNVGRFHEISFKKAALPEIIEWKGNS